VWEALYADPAYFLADVSAGLCDRSIGTVFQLPSPDAINSRDEEKKRRVGGYPAFVWFGARSMCCCG